MTCQWIEGSESSSHCMTDFFGFGACHSGLLVAIRWFFVSLVKRWCGWPRLYGCGPSLRAIALS
jgi:hypothetical protein